MPSIEQLAAALPARPDIRALTRQFVPPRRFADARFPSYHPRDPSQCVARERLETLAADLRARAGRPAWLRGLRARLGAAPGSGVYLDGGFGVGKTHLLAALWHAAPAPKAYLSFDELVYFIGLVGVDEARRAFAGHRLAAIDEWELDDPGNLKLALAFLRGALADGLQVVVTSNTLPVELGRGRFSRKDFRAEIEELAAAFDLLRIEGTDYRQRHFEADPGKRYFVEPACLRHAAAAAGDGAVLTGFDPLLRAIGEVHPIRYAGLIAAIDTLFVEDVHPLGTLVDALRWVHFVDKLYNGATPLRASGDLALGDLFPPDSLRGPYATKLSRCLSRMEEMLNG
ncbi:MAG TPA: cell division protein ZapE [Longimicrobiaceae bacterium]|nr:cell division protein ZapE [Longimicrobiaceae bacterium]